MIQVKHSPNLLESGMELRDSERSFKKLWFTIPAAVLILALIGLITYYFLYFKGPEICWAQASIDTEASDSLSQMNWKWSKIPTSCMEKTVHQKLTITQNGTFLIYGKVKRNTKSHIPFAAQVKKGNDVLIQSQSEEDIIILLGIHDLNEGDEISLNLNDDDVKPIEKNSTQTFWGIFRIPSYDS
ncbi:tumor necrosis factor ligand superfamily member 18 [Petaurus breviceps papuanus]|uniref:tumor necrosis factor ligand superfamily member 18 n=1 Tax=Petaurus breviceps papuanus TaxID=3040969 RepID=UPI0036D839F7